MFRAFQVRVRTLCPQVLKEYVQRGHSWKGLRGVPRLPVPAPLSSLTPPRTPPISVHIEGPQKKEDFSMCCCTESGGRFTDEESWGPDAGIVAVLPELGHVEKGAGK